MLAGKQLFFTPERKLVYFQPRTNTKVWILWIPIGFNWRCIIRYEFRKTRAACDKITHCPEENQPKSWYYSLIALEDVSEMIHFLQNCGLNASKLIHFLQYFRKCVQIHPLFEIFWKLWGEDGLNFLNKKLSTSRLQIDGLVLTFRKNIRIDILENISNLSSCCIIL